MATHLDVGEVLKARKDYNQGLAATRQADRATWLPLTLIAGPCALESRAHALEMAQALKEMAEKLKIGAAVYGLKAEYMQLWSAALKEHPAVKNGEVDVLIRNTTWTQSRDVTLGIDFNPTTYYDGQQMMGDPALLPGLSPSSGFEAIDGATVCTNAGTTTEKTGADGPLIPRAAPARRAAAARPKLRRSPPLRTRRRSRR